MSAPLTIARPTSGRRAGIQDAGGGAGQVAIAEGISNLADVGAKITDAEYRARAGLALAQSAGALDEAAAAIDADPDIEPKDYGTRYEEALGEVRAQYGADLPRAYRDAYEDRLGIFADRTRLGLMASGQKKQIATGQANVHEALSRFADGESLAKTSAEAELWRGEAATLVGAARAHGLFDEAEAFKAGHAYKDTVWQTALARGLDENPGRTRLELQLGTGPYAKGNISEEDRAKAILEATRREEAAAAAAEIQQRYELRKARQDETDEARMIMSKVYNEAVSPAGLEPENAALYMQQLTKHPDLTGAVARIMENGGRLRSGEPDRTYYGEVNRLRADNPRAFAELPMGPNVGPGIDHLDPEKLGTRFVEWADDQRHLLEKGTDYAAENHQLAYGRWRQVEDLLADVPLFSRLFAKDSHALAQAEGDYWNRVGLAQDAYKAGPGKGQEAHGPAFVELLDSVVLDLAEKYGDARIEGEVSAPTVGAAATLEGIAPATVLRLRASLRRAGRLGTDAQVRELYDKGVAAGTLEP